ncbi:hypothetical protein ACPA9J_09215 [Pseudomonas aeruginosa]
MSSSLAHQGACRYCRWPQLYTEMLDSSISGLQRPLAQKRRTWPSPRRCRASASCMAG